MTDTICPNCGHPRAKPGEARARVNILNHPAVQLAAAISGTDGLMAALEPLGPRCWFHDEVECKWWWDDYREGLKNAPPLATKLSMENRWVKDEKGRYVKPE